MSGPIDDQTLAELYAVALPSGAALRREAAEASTHDNCAQGVFDALYDALDDVPEPTGKRHDETCFTRHAPCLAARLRDLL